MSTFLKFLRTELEIESCLDFVFPPDILEDPVPCSKHCVSTLHNDNVVIANDLLLSGRGSKLHTLSGRPYTAQPPHERFLCYAELLVYPSTWERTVSTFQDKRGRRVRHAYHSSTLDVSVDLTNGAKVIL